MSRATVVRLSGCLVLLAGLGLFAVRGQGPGGEAPGKQGKEEGPKPKRVVYEVKRGVAKDLSELLGKVYKGEPGVQVLPAPAGNALVISAPPAVCEEVLQLLGRLDRRPRTVAIEVLVVEVPPRKGKGDKPAPETGSLDEREFRGDAEDVLAKLQNLQKKGLLGELKRFRLTTAENQLGSVRVGGSRPYVTGVMSRMGVVSRSLSYRDMGTDIKVTPQIGDDQRIALDLRLSDSRMRQPADGIVIGMDNGEAIRATEFLTATFEGRITVRSGVAEIAKGVTTRSPSGRGQTLVIVSARLTTAGAKGGK
jgi:hypothetical protein